MRSVKGLLLLGSAATLRAALESGRLTRDELEVRLEPEDLPWVEEKLDPTRWYPVASLGRMTELVVSVKGGARVPTLRAIGEKAAEDVRAQGTYAQMSFDEGAVREATLLEMKSFARQTATIHNALFDFGRPVVELDEEREHILIRYEDVRGYPEATRISGEGYTSRMASWALGRPCRVRAEDVQPDAFTFRFHVDG